MGEFWGCDTAQLVALADSAEAAAADISATIGPRLRMRANPSIWQGADGDEFRVRLVRLEQDADRVERILREAAVTLRRNADEQDQASGLAMRARDAASDRDMDGDRDEADEGQRRDKRGEDDDSATSLPDAAPVEGYEEGGPRRPDIGYDDDFPFESKKGEETWEDHVSWLKWKAILAGGQGLRADLDDSVELYSHYLDATGTPMEVDLEEGYEEDPGMKNNIDAKIAESQASVQQMIAEGRTDFSFTGPATPVPHYPDTENWQKTLGGHQQWSSGDVTVDAHRNVRMEVTVHAEDRYNFNAGQGDIATGASDDENGRFSELGWAQGFDVSGSVTRVVTWNVDDPDTVTVKEK